MGCIKVLGSSVEYLIRGHEGNKTGWKARPALSYVVGIVFVRASYAMFRTRPLATELLFLEGTGRGLFARHKEQVREWFVDNGVVILLFSALGKTESGWSCSER